MAEHHHNTMFRPPFNPSAVLAPPAHPTLSENEPIDQFIQSGADGSSYYPGYSNPSEQDYFSLFAEFAMDLTPPPSIKSQQQQQQQQPPVLGKTGLAPTFSTTAVPPEALNAARKRKKDGLVTPGTGTAPTKKASAAAKKAKKQQEMLPSDDEDDFDAADGSLPERERRLLKNRKAAQMFRKRQKNHILELEARVETLTTENSTLTSQVELLHAENKLIREQLDYMRSFVLNALQFTFPPSMPGMPAMHDLQKSIAPSALTRTDSSTDKDSSSRP
jgi:hypothetical protein